MGRQKKPSMQDELRLDAIAEHVLNRTASAGHETRSWRKRPVSTGAVVCAPSRGCLLSGKYSIHNGLKGNADDLRASEVIIPAALKPLAT